MLFELQFVVPIAAAATKPEFNVASPDCLFNAFPRDCDPVTAGNLLEQQVRLVTSWIGSASNVL